MNETTKSKKVWGDLEHSILVGNGIDIGCGPDPVTPTTRRFDMEDGDANEISKYVTEQFDFVYSSHCLEHMHHPQQALLEWWKLVKPGGHLFFTVPDEDLYEQGVFPSRFNLDHKATFTIAKSQSWSAVSYNVIDLVSALPNSLLISVKLQDHNYNRSRLKFGPPPELPPWLRISWRIYNKFKSKKMILWPAFERKVASYFPVDQTLIADTLAQIQCIVKKIN